MKSDAKQDVATILKQLIMNIPDNKDGSDKYKLTEVEMIEQSKVFIKNMEDMIIIAKNRLQILQQELSREEISKEVFIVKSKESTQYEDFISSTQKSIERSKNTLNIMRYAVEHLDV